MSVDKNDRRTVHVTHHRADQSVGAAGALTTDPRYLRKTATLVIEAPRR
jgi:hypothetical protein